MRLSVTSVHDHEVKAGWGEVKKALQNLQAKGGSRRILRGRHQFSDVSKRPLTFQPHTTQKKNRKERKETEEQ